MRLKYILLLALASMFIAAAATAAEDYPDSRRSDALAWNAAAPGNSELFIVAGELSAAELAQLNLVAETAGVTFAQELNGEFTRVWAEVDSAAIERLMAAKQASNADFSLRVMARDESASDWNQDAWTEQQREAVAGRMGQRGKRMHRGHDDHWNDDGYGHRQGHRGDMHKRSARGMHGSHGDWHSWQGCTHWERDWHQNGCGHVHVHNLADWLPDHAGYSYGWHYAGWDHDSWPYIRGDGSHIWYTGEFWDMYGMDMTPPVWFDAEWAAWGSGYPDRFWMDAFRDSPFYTRGGWHGHDCHGHGCGGCR